MTHLDDFTRAYVECALFTSELESHDLDEIDPDSLVSLAVDCARFQADNADDIAQIPDWAGPADSFGRSYYTGAECAGHDFWYTRNGHGVGFWARELGAVGDRLTRAAHAYGEAYLYVGDDGRIYAD